MSAPLLEYSVSARRLDSHSSEASCKSARLALDTDLAGNPQAFNPAEPKMRAITYEIAVSTDEPDRRLELLHQNVRRYGTVFNTVAPGTELSGTLRRA